MAEQKRERDIAEMEAQMAHDTDQYFEARPQIMRTRDKETTFEAGFKAAWKARALSHAEGEAVASLAIDKAGNELFGATFATQDLEPGLYDLYTHPAPQVAFSDTQEEIEARLADQLENSCPHCGGSGHKDDVTAPQVAVPDLPDEVTADGYGWLQIAAGEVPVDDAPTVLRAIAKHIVAAPTAPTGEPRQGDVEIPGDDGLDINALEQPVSDPDERFRNIAGALPGEPFCLEKGHREHYRRTGEQCTCQKAVILPDSPAPDEREIAARALDEFRFALDEQVRLKDDDSEETRTFQKVNGWLRSRSERLRAGKEGQDHG
ncbi:hypothetical protein ACEK07_04540 [Alcanivoracaceae bacterium MT1]